MAREAQAPADRVSAERQSAGVGLRLQAPARWPAFEAGAELRISLQNLGPRPLRFWLFDSLVFSLAGAGGQALAMHHGRDALGRGERLSPVLAPGQSHRVLRRAGVGGADGAGGARLQIDDGFGGRWWSDPLPGGPLQLAVALDHPGLESTVPDDGVAVWTGRLACPSIPVLR